jgi:hypothetical protein
MASSKNIAVKSPRKLIEVALPLDKINEAAAREKVSGTAILVPFISGGRVDHWQLLGQSCLLNL